MKLLTRNTDYAIRALCFIAKHKDMTSVEDLSNKLNIPKPFLRKVLQKLSKQGMLKSYKGKGGGFKILRNPNQISIIDVANIFQGPISLSEHLLKKKNALQ